MRTLLVSCRYGTCPALLCRMFVDECARDARGHVWIRRGGVIAIHRQHGELRIGYRLLPALEDLAATMPGVGADDERRTADTLDVFANIDCAHPTEIRVRGRQRRVSHHVRPPVDARLGHPRSHAAAL